MLDNDGESFEVLHRATTGVTPRVSAVVLRRRQLSSVPSRSEHSSKGAKPSVHEAMKALVLP
jgi:hypothetical protein